MRYVNREEGKTRGLEREVRTQKRRDREAEIIIIYYIERWQI